MVSFTPLSNLLSSQSKTGVLERLTFVLKVPSMLTLHINKLYFDTLLYKYAVLFKGQAVLWSFPFYIFIEY